MNPIEQLAVGCVLGDAYITKSGCLQIEHSIKQEAYVQWKYDLFKSYDLVGKPPRKLARYDKRTDKTYESVRFYTKAKFKNMRELFYKEHKKIIPKTIHKYLVSDLALAVFFYG